MTKVIYKNQSQIMLNQIRVQWMTGCASYNTINISVIDLRHHVEELLVNGPILNTDVLSAILLVHFSHNYKSVRRIVFTVDKP